MIQHGYRCLDKARAVGSANISNKSTHITLKIWRLDTLVRWGGLTVLLLQLCNSERFSRLIFKMPPLAQKIYESHIPARDPRAQSPGSIRPGHGLRLRHAAINADASSVEDAGSTLIPLTPLQISSPAPVDSVVITPVPKARLSVTILGRLSTLEGATVATAFSISA